MSILLMAVATFVGGHFILSSIPVRQAVARAVGETVFRALYSLVAAAALTWVILAYRAAPYVELWGYDPALARIPLIAMPVATILLAAAVTTRNPAAVGGEKTLDDPRPPGGILTVTRHPMLWAFLIWALSHLAANGDQASVMLFAGIAVLAAGGMAHIDYRRQALSGAAWGPVALTTSTIPFLAAIQGRCKVDWAGIGPGRVALGLAIYAALAVGHGWIAGVPLIGRF